MEMNLARIHDKHKLRKFWEEKIESHSQMMGHEEVRKKRSALSKKKHSIITADMSDFKLRDEWVERLKVRNQHLELLDEERVKKAQSINGSLAISVP